MSVVLQALGLEAPGYQGRIVEAAYTSPLGQRIPFLFQDVSREWEKRTTKFDFNGLDGWYVADYGTSGRDYPLRCIFDGPDHDLIATAFEEGLAARGKGRLEHPLYGSFDVVPTGAVTRRNDLVGDVAASIIEVTFSTTLASIYPSSGPALPSEISAAVAGFNLAAALEFQGATTLSSALDQASGKATIRKGLKAVRNALGAVSGQTAAARREFDSRYRLINEGLDTLVGQPLLLAQQVSGLVQAPARALAGLQSKLEGYALLADKLFGLSSSGTGTSTATAGAARRARNDLRIADLFAMSAVGAVVLATVDEEYDSRPGALAAAESMVAQMDATVEWREGRFEELEEVDEGGAYQALQESVALNGGYLVAGSFDLPVELRLVTDRARTAVDLCAQLYGDVGDEALQFFLDSNRLSGAEILEIPKGRTVVHYRAV